MYYPWINTAQQMVHQGQLDYQQLTPSKNLLIENTHWKQAGAELCQAQDRLEFGLVQFSFV